MAGVWPVLSADPPVAGREKFFITIYHGYLTPHGQVSSLTTISSVVWAGLTAICHGDTELVLPRICYTSRYQIYGRGKTLVVAIMLSQFN